MSRSLPALAVLVSASAVIAGCGGSSDSTSGAGKAASGGSGSRGTINLVAYSTPQVVYDQMIPGFNKTAQGKDVKFKSSYGPSGDQSRAVEGGQSADVVAFSLTPDVDRLVKDGLVDKTYSNTPSKGIVSDSAVVFVVRKGNPKHIKSWDDLIKPGVQVLTPNPFTSGGAKWNLMAAVGAKGLPYVKTLLTKHVPVQDKSGRASLQTFLSGKGDVSISYENEALTAQKQGEKVDYVIPSDGTIKIENPIAVTKKAPAVAKDFVNYALSPAGQQDFADWGYRPVDGSVLAKNKAKFPTPPNEFTIQKFGGWSAVNDKYFDPDKGLIAKIEDSAGVSTG